MEKFMDATCGVILAAGNSSRMGQPKAILPFEGKPFIAHVVAAMREAGVHDITVVLGKHRAAVKAAWPDRTVRRVVNAHPENGQVSSLNTALAHIGTDVRWLVMALVDQPAVSVKTYQLLLWAARQYPERIIIPRFQRKRGHPIVLPRNTWPLCRKAPPELGLHWVTHHPTVKVLDVNTNDAAIIKDIDTPQDYRELTGETLNNQNFYSSVPWQDEPDPAQQA